MICDYIVELLTPKQASESIDEELERFAERYSRHIERGYAISVPDNPMGLPRFGILEVIQELELPVVPEQLLIHFNTFHRNEDFTKSLRTAADMGIKYMLLVTGDGAERLSKLQPETLGVNAASVTSVELLQYVHREYPGVFNTGVAFNPYEPADHEHEKLRRKIDAGAQFIITQPIVDGGKGARDLDRYGKRLFAGAWMSKNLHLLSDCVGYGIFDGAEYDPIRNMDWLKKQYVDAGYGLYISMLPRRMDGDLASMLS